MMNIPPPQVAMTAPFPLSSSTSTNSTKIAYFIATGAYVGRIPYAPGTFGTLIAIPFAYALSALPLTLALLIFTVLCILGYLSTQAVERHVQTSDPSYIVIDEIIGFSGIFLFFDASAITIILGFILFRFFDIIKPGPVGWSERSFQHHTAGTLIDDLMAGYLSVCCLELMLFQYALYESSFLP